MKWKLSQRDQESDVDFKASIPEQDVWMPVETAKATSTKSEKQIKLNFCSRKVIEHRKFFKTILKTKVNK